MKKFIKTLGVISLIIGILIVFVGLMTASDSDTNSTAIVIAGGFFMTLGIIAVKN